jgi:hypothetical protein
MSEDEEFEFRHRLEQETVATSTAAEPAQPSMLSVAGNAAWKGIAGVSDMVLNVAGEAGNALIPKPFQPGYLHDPLKTGMTALGLIRPENEPQNSGQRILDTGVQAGVGMLAGPAKGGVEVAKNVATGLMSGSLGQMVKEATGSDLLGMAVGVLSPLALSAVATTGKSLLTSVGKATLQEAHEAGYVVQPSTVKPGFVTNRLESVAGKAAVAQDAALRNQSTTNRLAAKAIGLPEDMMITMKALEDVRAQAAKPYQEVAALTPPVAAQTPRWRAGQQKSSATILDELKQARADATAFFRHYDRSADPSSLTKAKQAAATADSLETQLETIATAAGKPELVDQLHAARQLYARTYDVERALNLGDGNVSASLIGRMLDKGRPLTGELKVIGKFAQAFPRVARDASSLPPPSVSGTDAAASAILGGIGYGAAGGPAGLLAAGLPLLRGPARSAVLSGAMQHRLLREPVPTSHPLLKGALVGRSLADYQGAVQ